MFWGLLHGLGLVIENKFDKRIKPISSKKVFKIVGVFLTFCFVCFAWIFFRIENIPDAIYCVRHMLDGFSNFSAYCAKGIEDLELNRYLILKMLVVLAPLVIYDIADRKKDAIIVTSQWSKWVNRVLWSGVLLLIVIFSMKGVATEFIYFQF